MVELTGVLGFAGAVYLCMKTVERVHTPKFAWERVKLPANYEAALAMIDEQVRLRGCCENQHYLFRACLCVCVCGGGGGAGCAARVLA